MATQKPTILLVAGAFHKAWHYYKLATHLSIKGYTVSIVELPSTTREEPEFPVYPNDVKTITNAIHDFTKLCGRDVVLVLHDYAGIPGSEAAVGLGRSSNLVEGADNNEGAVIKLIYLAAWLPLERQFHPELAWLENMESMEVVDEKDPRFVCAHTPRERFYNDISDEQKATSAVAALEPKAKDESFAGLERCAWREIPSAYVQCENDKAIAPQVTKAMVEAVQGQGIELQMVQLKSGHCPMLSMPKQTSETISNLI